jgi:enamine deaminase RidA (YjgF/YER057c/UK114 family)
MTQDKEIEIMSAEARLKSLGIDLPQGRKPLGNYVGAVVLGDALYVSGHIPLGPDNQPVMTGRLGESVSIEQGYDLARRVGVMILGTARGAIGDLDRIRRVVKVVGLINSTAGFTDQPKVLNGFSDLMVEVFGEEIGRHARSAIGVAALPMGAPVEVEAIFAL